LSKCAIASKLKLTKVSGPLGLFKELVPFLHCSNNRFIQPRQVSSRRNDFVGYYLSHYG
jgi:hypothetical protein